MERQVFNFPQVSANEPMVNDPFYHWLNERYNYCKINVVDRDHPDWYYYLMDIGFDVNIHIVTEESLNMLKNIEGHWFRCTPWFEPKSKTDLFFNANHLKGIIGAGNATNELAQMVIDSNWVYDVTPETTYFEITNGYLFAKYKFIIGGQKICKIKD